MTVVLWALAALAALAAEPEPSLHTLVYYNARMALREGQPLEAVKLWLLRNALEDRTGEVSPHDPDFHSVTWAALGELGICQDGYPTDEDGADLWRLALHNWIVRNLGRRKVKGPRPFDAFQVGRQARRISITDVLGSDELRAVQLYRGRCLRPRLLLFALGETVTADLSEPEVAARLLLFLLEEARANAGDGPVRGWAAVDARVFDLHLQLAALARREAQRDARDQARKGRAVGLSRESLTAMRAEAPVSTLDPDSAPARVLRACVDWPASEWMALSPERRVFLFDQARAFGGDPERLRQVALGVVDHLIEDGEGAELEPWIARAAAADEPAAREAIWGGDRGRRLLAMDRESGFRERAVVALPRGVHELEQGDLPGALRAMAFALQQAPDSRAPDAVQSLTRRWLSYTAARFESTDELLVTLQELVPSRDYSVILEDLMWRAAFHADRASFDRGLRHQVGRGALDRRLYLLQPLAVGDLNGFSGRIRTGLEQSPSETLRFLDQLVERLELEEAEVRAAHVPTLVRVRDLARPLSADAGASGRQAKTVAALLERTQAILEGEGLAGASARDRARALDPSGEVFAGSVRLAPADPFPWPFEVVEVQAPSVFDPLRLTPVEWRDGSGELVFGWRIGG